MRRAIMTLCAIIPLGLLVTNCGRTAGAGSMPIGYAGPPHSQGSYEPMPVMVEDADEQPPVMLAGGGQGYHGHGRNVRPGKPRRVTDPAVLRRYGVPLSHCDNKPSGHRFSRPVGGGGVAWYTCP